MGSRSLALVLLALVLAGCASPSAEPPGQQPVAEAPPAEPEASPPAEPPAEAPPVAETAPPKVEAHFAHDYRDAPEKVTFEIPEGAGPVRIRAGFRSPDGLSACSGQEARLVVKTPDGATLYDLKGPTVNLGMTDCESGAPEEQVVQAPGVYTVEFSGQGAIVGYVDAVTAG